MAMKNCLKPITQRIFPCIVQNCEADNASNGVSKQEDYSKQASEQGVDKYDAKYEFDYFEYLEVKSDTTEDMCEIESLYGDANDNYWFDRESERKNCLRKNFLKRSKISPGQRKQTLRWLMITLNCSKSSESVTEIHHLTIGLFDRYLQAERNISNRHLKLVAFSCVSITLKMVEGTQLTLDDFDFSATCNYSRLDLFDMEMQILGTLNLKLMIPTSYYFLTRCNSLTRAHELEELFGLYLIEIGFSSYKICQIKPSLQVAAAYFIIATIVTEPDDFDRVWTRALRYYTEYDLSDIKPVVRLLAAKLYSISKKGEKSVLFLKYADEKLGQVSKRAANYLPWLRKLKSYK